MGPLNPPTSHGNRYLLVVVDYLATWIKDIVNERSDSRNLCPTCFHRLRLPSRYTGVAIQLLGPAVRVGSVSGYVSFAKYKENTDDCAPPSVG